MKAFSRIGEAVYLLVVAGPVLMLALTSLPRAPELWELAFPRGQSLNLLSNSLVLATAVALSDLVCGTLIAVFLWRRSGRLGGGLRLLVLLTAPLPPYIHALAWIFAFDTVNFRALTGLVGAWWVEVMAYLPLSTCLALLALEMVQPDLLEAGKLLAPDQRVLTRILGPLATPFAAAGAGLIFLLCLLEYGVPSIFGAATYPLEIYAEFSSSGDPARVFFMALPLFAAAALVLLATFAGYRGSALNRAWSRPGVDLPFHWPAWLRWAQGAALLLLAAQVIVPVATILTLTKSLAMLGQVLAFSTAETRVSFQVSLLASLLSLSLGAVVAHRLRQPGPMQALWWAVVVLPLALPASLVGAGLIDLWNRPSMLALQRTWAMPVLAATARFAPVATLVILVQLSRTDPRLLEAAAILAPSRIRAWVGVRIPLLLPGLLASAGLVFILTAGELATTLMVVPPGGSTLVLKVYNYLHYGSTETVAALCLLLTLATLLPGAVVVRLVRRRK
ncbi:iron ABC transporter permease [bacterium CPR1]|nr:iron ABC transporter permease [bacterium CPR1]